MIEGVAYLRVSSAEQLREGFSIAAQRALIRNYANARDITIVAEFSDDETAKRVGRSDFSRMLAHLEQHPSHVLLVEKTDRLYRNIRDYLTLDELGTEIHFVKEGGKDRNDSDSRFMHLIRVGMARKYVENLSEEVKKGMRQKCAEGGWPTWAPVGYLNVKDSAEKKSTGGIIPDPAKAPLIVEMFEAAATGRYTLGALRDLAAQKGLKGQRGARLGKQQIANMLRTTAYFGVFTWSGVEYRGKYAPIISRELFDRASRAMREGAKPKVNRHAFAFAGMIRCGDCGGLLTGDLKKGAYVYYACRCSRAAGRWYREAIFDGAVSDILHALLLPVEARERIMERIDAWYADTTKAASGRALRVRSRLTEIENLTLSAYEEKLQGKLPETMWRQLSERWRDEERKLRGELQTIAPAIERDILLRKAREPFELVQTVANEYLDRSQEERGVVIRTCCSNLLVTAGNVSIQLRSPFHLIAKMTGEVGWLGRVDVIRTFAEAILAQIAA